MKDYIELQLMRKLQDLMVDIYRTTQSVPTHRHLVSKIRRDIKDVNARVSYSYQSFLEEERIAAYDQAMKGLENIVFYTRMLAEYELFSNKEFGKIKNQADFLTGFLTGLSIVEKKKLRNHKLKLNLRYN